MSCFNGTWSEWQLIMRQRSLEISDRHLLSSEETGWCSNILGFLFMRYELQLKETLVLGLRPELRQDRHIFIGNEPHLCHFRNLLSFLMFVRVQLKRDGTWWHTGREVKGELTNEVGSQYPLHYLGTWCIQHYYRWCAQLACQQSTELTPPPI
jgi:hypothetical protein